MQGQAFWLLFGVWKSDSPEGAKHKVRAYTQAAHKHASKTRVASKSKRSEKRGHQTSSFNSFRCLYTVARPMFSTLAT